ncbi:MAG: hypothetical protein JWQ35_510 [Bacteriovoracaceae bacterium]|nr:hypothetical protein [Bacteriovoracaceae bacterium]
MICEGYELKDQKLETFESHVLPHLKAGYNLARWMMREDSAAEDMVQEASLKAFEAFSESQYEKAKPWFLKIVRNCCFTQLRKIKLWRQVELLDETLASSHDPESHLIDKIDGRKLNEAIQNLPEEFREVFILHEVEGLSYEEISEIVSSPIGTVMSRLSRARKHLQRTLLERDFKSEVKR